MLPIVRTKEALQNICERINFLQDYFSRELVLENITAYFDFNIGDFDEIEFLQEILKRTGSSLLLDISNVVINHGNRKQDPMSYFHHFPLHKVKQIHLAGGSRDENIKIDSHCSEVSEFDISILKAIYSKGFEIPAMIERDANIPPFKLLEEERLKIKDILYEV